MSAQDSRTDPRCTTITWRAGAAVNRVDGDPRVARRGDRGRHPRRRHLLGGAERGLPALNLDLLTKDPIPFSLTNAPQGLANAFVGTIVIVGLATLMALPVGILVAIYLNEFAPASIRNFVTLILDILNGVPAIVIGIFVFGLFVVGHGQSGLAGAFALACLMLPLVSRSTMEILVARSELAPRGEPRPRRAAVAHDAEHRAAAGDRRHPHGHGARGRARRRRDRAAAPRLVVRRHADGMEPDPRAPDRCPSRSSSCRSRPTPPITRAPGRRHSSCCSSSSSRALSPDGSPTATAVSSPHADGRSRADVDYDRADRCASRLDRQPLPPRERLEQIFAIEGLDASTAASRRSRA